jgi:hypothetical protein
VPEFHARCIDPDCWYRCRRPGCRRPDSHIFQQFDDLSRHYFHRDDCAFEEMSLPEQVVAELHPGISPDELAVAQRVLNAALEELRELQRTQRRPRIA